MAKKDQAKQATPVQPLLDSGAETARWMFPVFVFLILAGFFALRFDGVKPGGNRLTHDRAVFTAVNAATCTGFQLSDHPTEFFGPGKAILFALMTCGALFSLIVGGMALRRILRLEWGDGRIVAASIGAIVACMVLGLFAPAGASRANTAFDGVFGTVAAFANCGLYIGERPLASDPFTHLVLMPLAVLGGLGMVVILEIVDALARKRAMSAHARTVLRLSALAYLVGFIGCAVLQMMDMPWQGPKDPWASVFAKNWTIILRNASLLCIDSRSAGVPVVSISSQPRALGFFLMVLMAAGAGTAGTAGGLRLTTIREIVLAPLRIARGEALGRTFVIAMTWAGSYLGALMLFQLLLLSAQPQIPGDRLLFITISALSNVGLSHDTIAATGASLYYLSAAMFAGRVVPLLMLWWMADTVRDGEVA